MKKIEIEIPEGKELKLINGVYTLVDPQDITERIKTFEDACRELGEDHPLVKEWQMCRQNISSDLKAYLCLRIITEALNEGWTPQFTKDEGRWYLWYKLITKEEYYELYAEDKNRVIYLDNDFVGFLFKILFFDASYKGAFIGSRLVFKSRELAEYAGKQFTNLYIKFCF